jgi:diadenosine tetraphosphate (Ap4A) HIT family hydrolase
VRTAHWDIVHCWPTSHEGWLVLASRVHHDAVAELSEEAAVELGTLLRVVSQALHDRVGAVKTYVAQFAEHPNHQHVHVHLIPRAADHPDELKGPRVFDRLGDVEAVSEERMNELALDLRAYLVDRLPS